jgi:hypothetical protein
LIKETNSKDMIKSLKEIINKRTHSLLDVGCGICSMLGELKCKSIIALDTHRPYLMNRVNRHPRIIPIHANALTMNQLFLPKSISSVLFNDSLEHFNKQEGLQLLSMAEEIAINHVIVFTPRGFFPQKGFDFYGLKGEAHQEHKSGWEPEEFVNRGYHVTVFRNFHGPNNKSFLAAFGKNHPPVDAILAWKEGKA